VERNRYIITFGQGHTHRVNNTTFDRNSVGVITANSYAEAREIAFELFGDKFFTVYDEKLFDESGNLKYYPRGKFKVNF